MKQIQGLVRNGGNYQIFLNQQYEFYRSKQNKRMIIRYFPEYGYLDRYKFNWMKCKSCGPGYRWSYSHLLYHNLLLYDNYQLMDSSIKKAFEENVPIDAKYQYDICKRVKSLNMELMDEIQKHGDRGNLLK